MVMFDFPLVGAPAGIQSNSQYSEQLLVMFSLVMIQLKQVCSALWKGLGVGGGSGIV